MTDADDLDAFIQQQKAKIARERDATNTNPKSDRRKWDKQSAPQALATSDYDDRPDTPEETGLPLAAYNYEQKRKKLRDDRRKEYNDLMEGSNVPIRGRPDTPDEVGLPLGTDDEKHRKLQEDRRREYNDIVKNQPIRKRPATPQHEGLPLGGGTDEKRKQLAEQRQREYKQLLEQQAAFRRKARVSHEHVGLPLGQHSADKKKLEEQRKNEYQEFLRKQQESRKIKTPEHIGLPLTNNDKVRKQLEVERRNEYNALIAQKDASLRAEWTSPENVPRDRQSKHTPPVQNSRDNYHNISPQQKENGPSTQHGNTAHTQHHTQPQSMKRNKENLPPNRPETPEAALVTKMGSYEERQKRLKEERKREYNELLAAKTRKGPQQLQKEEPRDLDLPDEQQQLRRTGKVDEQYKATIPGLEERLSAQDKKRKKKKVPTATLR